jgi:hypothetical protein
LPRFLFGISGDKFIEGFRVRQIGQALGLKIEKKYPFPINSPLQQSLPEQREDSAFPTPAHSGNHLYDRLIGVSPEYFLIAFPPD